LAHDAGAGRAGLHLQDLVPLRQENNAGREFKQSRLCGNCRRPTGRSYPHSPIANSTTTQSTSSTKIPSPLALSVPTRCRGYTVLVTPRVERPDS
ncbi:hypothetical protein BKA70DRAFT_1578010, partial [Coprinopsis sp. MPI-PUGE-AT-0042]